MNNKHIFFSLIMVLPISSLANENVIVDTSEYEEKTLKFNKDMTINIELLNIVPNDKDKYKIVRTIVESERAGFPAITSVKGTKSMIDGQAGQKSKCHPYDSLQSQLSSAVTESDIKKVVDQIEGKLGDPTFSNCVNKMKKDLLSTQSKDNSYILNFGSDYTFTIKKEGKVLSVYEYKSDIQDWYVHAGFTFIASKDDRYFTPESGSDSYIIQKQGSEPDWNYAATALFSYPVYDIKNSNFELAISAGLGVSQESILVLAGPSLVFADNFILNLGVVMTQFDVLKGVYKEGQDVGENAIDSSALTEEQFKASWGITFAYKFQ